MLAGKAFLDGSSEDGKPTLGLCIPRVLADSWIELDLAILGGGSILVLLLDRLLTKVGLLVSVVEGLLISTSRADFPLIACVSVGACLATFLCGSKLFR